jgi:nicotinamide-nucleotide amidase
MKAEIIASGTELLLGQIADTNTQFIANQLAILGIDLYFASIVGDNYDRFLGVLKQAFERSDIVIVTGGLGPTKGDITREVIAGLLGEKMEIDPLLKQRITGYFSRTGMEMPENNLKQATLIPSATAIPNPLGTAPGWWVEKDGKTIISLPGPPGEMQPMWQKEINPRLERKGGAVIVSRILKTWGLSESRIDQLVGQFMSLPNPTLALYAKPDGIQLRITAKSTNREDAVALIRERENSLREILKDNIWGVDNESLEQMISQLLIAKGLSVAVAESFTAGFLAYSLSNIPESQQFFKGGIIIADDKTRTSLEIVPKSTDAKGDIQTASRMASMARERFATDIGIGIDAAEAQGEDGMGQAFISINIGGREHNISQSYRWRSQQLGRRSVTHTLFCLKKALEGL